MTTHRTIALWSPKGGSGVTTTACLLALAEQRKGHSVRIVGHQNPGDLSAVLGLPQHENSTVINLGAPGTIDRTIVDCGTDPTLIPFDAETFMVLRPCYVALRRALDLNTPRDIMNQTILLTEKGRTLSAKDIEECLGTKVVTTISVTPEIARMVDAGIMACHPRASKIVNLPNEMVDA